MTCGSTRLKLCTGFSSEGLLTLTASNIDAFIASISNGFPICFVVALGGGHREQTLNLCSDLYHTIK